MMTTKEITKMLKRSGIETVYTDCHTHTNTYGSDGKLTPEEQITVLYKNAYDIFVNAVTDSKLLEPELKTLILKDSKEFFQKTCGVYVSITDHNTAGAYDVFVELLNQGSLPNNLFIKPGVEIEALDAKGNIFDVTLIGIDQNWSNTYLAKHYKEQVVSYKNDLEDYSAEMQYKAFLQLGLELPILLDKNKRYRKTGIRANDTAHDEMYRLLFEKTEDITLLQFREKPEIKAVIHYLLDHGYDPSAGRRTYYRSFITLNEANNPFYLDQTHGRKSMEEIILHTIKDSPNVYILRSHIGSYDAKKYGTMEDIATESLELYKKIDSTIPSVRWDHFGLETIHRGMSRDASDKATAFCRKHGLFYCGGSDMHDPVINTQRPFHVDGGSTLITTDMVHPAYYNIPDLRSWNK